MDFQVPKITHEEVKEHRGVFVIEPLDRGFGHTFGNSLRRVLLSSLEGAAVTSVKIEGVSHEFTTLPGVREDVTDMFSTSQPSASSNESPEVEVRLSARVRQITAADQAPADLEIWPGARDRGRSAKDGSDHADRRSRPRLRGGRGTAAGAHDRASRSTRCSRRSAA
jgi:hypothetical protein